MKKWIVCFFVTISNFCIGQERCDFFPPSSPNYSPRPTDVVNIPVLNSYTSSSKVIYIDFDGEVTNDFWWADGNTITSEPSGLNETEIREVFDRVAEDFSPFNINVTTDINVFNSALVHHKMRVIVSPTSWWMQGVTGAAMYGSFSSMFNNNTPCFVFTDRLQYNPRYIAESVSHEVGHTLGLHHQSLYDANCNLIQESNQGSGPVSSDISWAPIMGNSALRSQTTWGNGPVFNCATTQDNIAVIKDLNGITFRPRTSNQTYNLVNTLNIKALILPNDIDSFYITLNTASVVRVSATSGGNTDLRMRINGVIADDANLLDASSSITLQPGTHLLELFGVDNQFLPNYGNTGQADIQLSATPATVVALNDNKIFATASGISWQIEIHGFQKVMLQRSANGRDFTDHNLSLLPAGNYPYTAYSTTYFRNKVFKVNGDLIYSGTVVMRGIDEKWSIFDLTGRIIKKGSGIVTFEGLPRGYYIIRSNGRSEKFLY